MMNARLWMGALGVVATALGMGYRLLSGEEVASASLVSSARHEVEAAVVEPLFVAPGVTEPRSKTIDITSVIPGRIRSIQVRAGDVVHKGELLAELENELQVANVALARAKLDRVVAGLRRLENGDRKQERDTIRAQLEEAEAVHELAKFEAARIEETRLKGSATDREVARAANALTMAESRHVIAQRSWELSCAGARWEDIVEAKAAVSEAEAKLESAKTLLEKTMIRSPIDAKVIYRYLEPGETVPSYRSTPILALGDCTRIHVRVDVDEADIGRVWINQRVYATVPAFGDRKFHGSVVHIEPTLGRKNFRTFDPAERFDTKILEVVVRLDDGLELPIELQTAVWFLEDSRSKRGK